MHNLHKQQEIKVSCQTHERFKRIKTGNENVEHNKKTTILNEFKFSSTKQIAIVWDVEKPFELCGLH